MKPRILFVMHLPPPIYGASTMGQYVRSSGVIAHAVECDFVNLTTTKSMEEIGRGRMKKVGVYLGILCSVIVKLAIRHYDLCYMTLTTKGIAFYKDAVIVGLLKLFRLRIIYHLHNKGVSHRQHAWLGSSLYKWVFRNTAVILLSRHLYSDIQKYVQAQQVYYCANGIPTLGPGAVPCRADRDTLNILYLSHMMESKGVYVLLSACQLLKERGYKFSCTCVGGPGDITPESFDRTITEKGLAAVVSRIGPQYGEEKIRCYQHADIFAAPTFDDCFPLVLLEAMQFSLPIVSTYEGGIPDIVEHGRTGLLCPRKDPVSLADSLECLIRNEDMRKQMGIAGRLKYEEEYTLEQFERRLAAILKAGIRGKKEWLARPPHARATLPGESHP